MEHHTWELPPSLGTDNPPQTYSILIPAYNEASHIGDLLQHLCARMPESVLEILVCDNASTDNTAAIVKSWTEQSSLIRLITSKTEGKPAAWNLLVEEAKASTLVFLDADIVPDSHCLDRLLAATKRGQSLVYAGQRRYWRPNLTLSQRLGSFPACSGLGTMPRWILLCL